MTCLQVADLKNAHFEGANLQRANLEEANLRRANLEEANLRRANLFMANLAECCSMLFHILCNYFQNRSRRRYIDRDNSRGLKIVNIILWYESNFQCYSS